MLLIEKLNKLVDKGVPANQITNIANKSPATISRFLNGNSIIDLTAAIKIVKRYFPEEERELMTDFCKKLDRKNGRTAIEYSKVNGYHELTEFLIKKLYESKNRSDTLWAKMYELELLRSKSKVKPLELLDMVSKVKVDSKEMKVYSFLLMSYCYADMRQFDMIQQRLQEIEFLLDKINDPYIRESYKVRFGQALSVSSLYQNNIQNCRKYGQFVIESEPFQPLSAHVYHAIGLSYIFESQDQSIQFLENARNLAIERNNQYLKRQTENSLNFIQNYYGLKPMYLQISDEVSDQHELAFYHIMRGNRVEASKILNNIPLDKISDYHKGFHFFYRGKLSGKEEHFYHSILYFKKAGDFFFRQVSCIELQKLGTPSYALKVLSS